jgi:hypothetical protein
MQRRDVALPRLYAQKPRYYSAGTKTVSIT